MTVVAIPAVGALGTSLYIEHLKHKHDLVTYEEILAFENGEDVRRDAHVMARGNWAKRHPVLYRGTVMLLAAAIGFVASYIAWGLLH